MNRLDKLLIIIFLSLICSPYIGSLLGISSVLDSTERRNLSKIPNLKIEDVSYWPEQITNYFNDNFGFRNIFLFLYEYVRLNILDTKSIHEQIVNNGWVMYVGPGTKTYYDHIVFSKDELKRIKEKLEKERDFLEKRHIPYFIVIAPRKENIYYEYFPFQPEKGYFLQVDQLTSYLKNNSTLDVIDLRKPTYLAKTKGLPLFYKTDTHWNNYGAFISYQNIMSHYNIYHPTFKPLVETDFNIELERYQIWQGDNILKTASLRAETDQGVKMTLKEGVLEEKPKTGIVLALGDSYMHIIRGIPKYGALALSPQMNQYIPLLFKNPDIKNDELLIPKVNLEQLIPIIYQTIPDKTLAQKLINYLKVSGVKSDDSEGLGTFLELSFDKIIYLDKDLPLSDELLNSSHPDLVIRETIQNGLETFLDLSSK